MFHRLCRFFALATVTACLTATLTIAAPAAVTILYVSTTGSNSNPCTLAQPCRSLQYAINRTPVGNEVHILDSGFYGNNAKINKSITVVGNGHTLSLGAPITINEATATVHLRRLVLNGGDSTLRGIDILAAAVVHIEHCVVHNFSQQGIQLSTTNSDVFISDSISRNNGFNGVWAIGAGSAKLSIDNSRFERNGTNGIYAENIESSVSRTINSGNSVGIYLRGGRMNVTSSTSANNSSGFIVASAGAMVLESVVARGNTNNGLHALNGSAVISNSAITHNGTGILKAAAGTVLTRENNAVTGNTTDIDGALTPLGGT